MTRYCSQCGSELREVGDFGIHWFTVFECSSGSHCHDFIEIGDQRWIFPLLDLSHGVKQCLLASDQALVKLAASRLKRVDCKTVSIVGFEQTITNTYREADHAQISTI